MQDQDLKTIPPEAPDAPRGERRLKFGTAVLETGEKPVGGTLVEIAGEPYYRISNFDRMDPFFMTVVSDSNHWMFLSSRGGLTCGRRNPDFALFPYYTDDKIHDAATTTGPLSVFKVRTAEGDALWEPFNPEIPAVYDVTRNLYKNLTGNRVIFEEVNHSLGAAFRYSWMNSDAFGFVRQTTIRNLRNNRELQVEILDGIRNLLPYGVKMPEQATMSTLVDGYKKGELHAETGLGIYTLSSVITDRAEPSEALKATTVWSAGLDQGTILLSTAQVDAFRRGASVRGETAIRGKRGAYLLQAGAVLPPEGEQSWVVVADVAQGPSAVVSTIACLRDRTICMDRVLADVERGTRRLQDLVAGTDGVQETGDRLMVARHFSNTLFNVMRGGYFPESYGIDRDDFLDFVGKWNRPLFRERQAFLEGLPETGLTLFDLLERAGKTGSPDLFRLACEYLPLTFSRRHGDPSRPWNQFSIDVKRDDGARNLHFQGNWRDIFQNWEALALSFPGFAENFIAKFVNASTVDGYNPYRVTRDGIDWETFDPDDPWSNIGYWGDHQIIYLLKLVELAEHHHPGKLQDLFHRDVFVYANVPYRIKPYAHVLGNVRDTIVFDDEREERIKRRVRDIGADGKLVLDGNGAPYRVNLAEKFLVPLLSKLANFVPEGGIWMNTQRPEWNDANNALVGNGLSMVTLYYLRRYVVEMGRLFPKTGPDLRLSREVAEHLRDIRGIFQEFVAATDGDTAWKDTDRRAFVDALGAAGDRYRQPLYRGGFSGEKQALNGAELLDFFELVLGFVNHSIRRNRREDGLYHAYNLVRFEDGRCSVSHLQEMLEGQVAVLSSGFLGPEESVALLDSLRRSRMYRSDLNTYTLYPDRVLPGFLEKNIIPPDAVAQSPLIQRELENDRGRLFERDPLGQVHFNGAFRNAADLKARLKSLDDVDPKEAEDLVQLFDAVFRHWEFTGRSGTLFKYEGLGCVYWHMVSKLLLSVQETFFRALDAGADPVLPDALKRHYFEIKAGLGLENAPETYGAFPIDAYSHTPGFAGAQQPGMTGQVKEDFLARFGELGCRVLEGRITFQPALLRESEFLRAPASWTPGDRRFDLQAGELGFTYCGTPVIFKRDEDPRIEVHFTDREAVVIQGLQLPADLSRQVFNRCDSIDHLKVSILRPAGL